MSDVVLTLSDVAQALGLTPLEVLAQCSLLGLPCPDGLVDTSYVEILRSVRLGTTAQDGEYTRVDESAADDHEVPAPHDPTGRRLWTLQRTLARALRTGKIWPARTDPRSLARGSPDVGLGVAAVSALERAGLLTGSVKRGEDHRVGITPARRAEAERLIETGEAEDLGLRNWIEGD